ncbi:hypothetical protein [Neobacillus sp. NPDC093127]|uniref:hypothetical protein n=1 Tax=Neobacillus sp. NPDC093127 TaxID=3364296 RepID=UPI00380C822D
MINQTEHIDHGVVIFIHTRKVGVKQILIDKEDWPAAEQIQRLVLYKDPKGREFARSDKNNDQVLLHRHLFDIPKGSRMEWLNGNTLDLRKENIQLVDTEGTVTLLKEPVEESVPKPVIKGVTFHKGSQKWTSRPYHGSDRYSLGYFTTKEEAENETLIFLNEGPNSPNLKRNQPKGVKK